MATRFYLEADATLLTPHAGVNPSITHAYDGAWGVTGGAARRWATVSPATLGTTIAATSGIAETSSSAVNVLARQFISAGMESQLIDGTVKGQIRVHESNADADMKAQVVIRVCSNDGTSILATLLAADASALSSEFAITTGTNRQFPLAAISPATLTSYTCAVGDRLLIEIGYRAHNTTATSRNAIFRFGSSAGADLAEDETSTTDNNPWIEFSDTITFDEPYRRVTQAALLASGSATAKRRFTQAALQVSGSAPAKRRFTQVALLVAGRTDPTVGGEGWGILLS